MSLKLLNWALIMRRVVTENSQEKKQEKKTLNWIVGRPTTNQSNAVSQLFCIAQFSNTESSLTLFILKVK